MAPRRRAGRGKKLLSDPQRRAEWRIALALGRTRRELLDTIGADELVELFALEANFDLPDGYLVAGELGALLGAFLGGSGRRQAHAPYYLPAPKQRGASDPSSFRGFLAFARTHASDRERPATG